MTETKFVKAKKKQIVKERIKLILRRMEVPKPIRFSSLKLFSINLNRKKLFVILLNKSELLNLLRAIVATQKSKIANIIFIDNNDIKLSNDISLIKNYIDMSLGIDCYLNPRVLTKKNGNFDKLCINCYIKNKLTIKPLIIVWPDDRKFIYDPINLHSDNIIGDIKRTKEKHIENNDVIKLFQELINECKDKVNKSNK